MTQPQIINYLKKQIHKDNCIIRFWNHHHTRNIKLALTQIHWAKVSLKIANRSLSNLTATIPANVQQLICKIFGSACAMALHVASRESGFCTCAVNGQYLGIFQMGSSERAKFATIGYSTAYEQIVAAHNYFLVSGWSPWSQTAY